MSLTQNKFRSQNRHSSKTQAIDQAFIDIDQIKRHNGYSCAASMAEPEVRLHVAHII